MPEESKNPPVRPTKKQKELLTFIEAFIAQHGYSPSYREIMTNLSYNSVATVALHVNNLIKRGHLQKRDHSARSLEVIKSAMVNPPVVRTNQVKPGEEKWLIEKIDYFFNAAEQTGKPKQSEIDELYVLVGTLKILGLDGAAQSFIARLTVLKKKVAK